MPLSFIKSNVYIYLIPRNYLTTNITFSCCYVSLPTATTPPPKKNMRSLLMYAEDEKSLSSNFVYLKELFGKDKNESLCNGLSGLSFRPQTVKNHY